MMSLSNLKRLSFSVLCALAAVLSAGCATGPNANPKDPLEPMNRSISKFNDTLDDNVLKPAAIGYRDYTPQLLQTGVNNFFRNLSDVMSTVNNGLQLKGHDTAESFMRVTVNSIFGIYGIFDVATPIGLDRHPEDFGQTLGYWGVPNGPYVVLPLLGPSTVRDSSVLPLEFSLDPVSNHNISSERTAASVLRVVDKRANLLQATNFLSDAAIDKYSFTRDSYLQFRRNQVFDGNPPEDDDLVDPSAESVKPSAK
jgi:phospholipid-binding lipoprotein MlaA|nr:VacJ family lipoprotein [uncultured Limnohabitans sp.]